MVFVMEEWSCVMVKGGLLEVGTSGRSLGHQGHCPQEGLVCHNRRDLVVELASKMVRQRNLSSL